MIITTKPKQNIHSIYTHTHRKVCLLFMVTGTYERKKKMFECQLIQSAIKESQENNTYTIQEVNKAMKRESRMIW